MRKDEKTTFSAHHSSIRKKITTRNGSREQDMQERLNKREDMRVSWYVTQYLWWPHEKVGEWGLTCKKQTLNYCLTLDLGINDTRILKFRTGPVTEITFKLLRSLRTQ